MATIPRTGPKFMVIGDSLAQDAAFFAAASASPNPGDNLPVNELTQTKVHRRFLVCRTLGQGLRSR
jgi:hypothetical protein